jgi:hypothetical protein
MIDRVAFAWFCWLTIGTFVCAFGLAAMVRIDWREIRRVWRRWRDSR